MQSNNAKAERSATRFFGALRDVFVGAPVQRMRAKGEGRNPGFLLYPFSFILFLLGQSGFINLMRSSFFVGSFIVPRYSLVRSSFCE
jgi:hypothetical protein